MEAKLPQWELFERLPGIGPALGDADLAHIGREGERAGGKERA